VPSDLVNKPFPIIKSSNLLDSFMSKPYTPIGYRVNVVLQAETIEGKASDTQKSETGEYLILEKDDGTKEKIRADQIKKMVVLDDNAKFKEHLFKKPTLS